MSKKDEKPSTRGAKQGEGTSAEGGGGRGRARAPRTPKPPAVGIAGVPGSKNPDRRCTATVRSTGERCKRAAIKGGFVCTSHGGASPQVRKKAKERLMELLDPALASLHKVLTDPKADDSTKVRAALGILDRTGHGPGAKLEIGLSKWDELIESGDLFQADRSVLSTGETQALTATHSWEDYDQASRDAQAEAWRDLDREDAEAYERGRIRPDENTVKGQVLFPDPPDTRDAPSEHDPLVWPYARKPT